MQSGKECKAARSALCWSRNDLAEMSQVSVRTLIDFENGVRIPTRATHAQIKQALLNAGATFDNGLICVRIDRIKG